MVVTERASQIEGWMLEVSLEWLGEQARLHHRIVEVGSYLGRSTRALADNLPPGGVVFAFDSWHGPWEIDMPTEVRSGLFGRFCENLADHIVCGRVVPIKGDHRLPPFGLHPDMVFIDGDHSLPYVAQDISFWRTQLPLGGLLCGDDWDYPPVETTVKALLGEPQVTSDGRIWSIYV